MKKVISIAVFGDGDKYAKYLPSFMLAHLNLFPKRDGWKLHVHVDNIVATNRWGAFLRVLESRGLIHTEFMGTAILTKSMLWRLAPVFDKGNDYVFCRDLDALPMPRDRRACDQFITSGASAHTVHDNVQHVGMMGGLCGFKSAEFRRAAVLGSLEDLYKFAAETGETNESWEKHGTDQNVLNRLISQRPAIQLLEHRYAGWQDGQPGKVARGPGSYGCESWSTMLPDVGEAPQLDEKTLVQADSLAAHLGSAGYDHDAAITFWGRESAPELLHPILTAMEVLQ